MPSVSSVQGKPSESCQRIFSDLATPREVSPPWFSECAKELMRMPWEDASLWPQ